MQTTNPKTKAPCKGGKDFPSNPIQPKNIKHPVPITSAIDISTNLHDAALNGPTLSPSFNDSEKKLKINLNIK